MKFAAAGLALINLALWQSPGIRELTVYFDPWLVVSLLPATYTIGMAAIPLLIRGGETDRARHQYWAQLLSASGVILCFETVLFVLVGIGAFCRGPNWNFYWPWQERVPYIVARNNINLSEYFWFDSARLTGSPDLSPLVREAPGIVLLVIHLIIVPALACLLLRRYTSRSGFYRLLLFAVIVQLMAIVPAKVALRHIMHWKYIVALPECSVKI